MSVRIESPGTSLADAYVRLVPPAPAHAPELFALAADPEIWRYSLVPPFASVADVEAFVAERAAARHDRGGDELAYVVLDRASGRVAGMTRLYEISERHRTCALGWTWYGAAFRRTAVNTATKCLLLEHAFERLHLVRVQFTIDARNAASIAAVERLGATREGVLRRHRRLPDGFVRDTVVYAILADEWPHVRTLLGNRLVRPALPDLKDRVPR